MSLLEGYISDFTYARYYFLYVEFSDFYVNQSLTGQTIPVKLNDPIILLMWEHNCMCQLLKMLSTDIQKFISRICYVSSSVLNMI
jgi:hypothetical protein